MKLRYSPTSPYVRKVTITAIETGLDARIERIPTNPLDPATDLAGDNPIGKVPALITDGGEVLYDSPVICEYIDGMHDGYPLIPPSGGVRWTALRRQALADGILDASVLVFLETSRRPEAIRWDFWIERQTAVIGRSLDVLEDEVDSFGHISIGLIAIGCALGYLDFRLGNLDWRFTRPNLAEWYRIVSERRSMQETVPADPA